MSVIKKPYVVVELFSARLSVSRVLSRLVIYLDPRLLADSSGSCGGHLAGTLSFRLEASISLQQAGFTIFRRHRRKLRAFTSLVSPLPSASRKWRAVV